MGCVQCALRESIAAYRHPGGGVTVVYPDPIPDNPRDDDNLGRLAFNDRRLRGDEVDDLARSTGERKEIIAAGGLVFPVLVHEHSGLSFRLRDGNAPGYPFTDPWDTRCAGVMTATAESIRRFFGVEEITGEIRERAKDGLRSELRRYEDYCNGAVYGFRNYAADWCESDDCWGFFGIDHRESGLFGAAGLPENPAEYDVRSKAA